MTLRTILLLFTILLPSLTFSQDRKSTRLNSSHMSISYAVFCLKKKKKQKHNPQSNNQIYIKRKQIPAIIINSRQPLSNNRSSHLRSTYSDHIIMHNRVSTAVVI